MFESIIKNMREKVRACDYVMTLHADDEMDADELSIYDVERCILVGAIVERQRDKVTAESKYRVQGAGVGNNWLEVVAKLSPTGKLVIITVYRISEKELLQ